MTTDKKTGRRGITGVGIMFASNGAIFAALLPWYPTIATRLNLSAVEFGFMVASFAVGAIVSSALPARLIARYGPVKVSIVGTVLLALAIIAAPWATTGWMFAACLFFAGFFDAIVDVAQNVAGIRVQDVVGRSILSSMHAFWSLGGVASGAISTAAAAAGVDMRLQLAIMGVAGATLVIVGALMTASLSANPAPAAAPAATTGSRSQRWGRVTLLALPLVIIAICGTMVEDIANNWAAMAGMQLVGLPAQVAGLAFTVVIGAQCIGRFTGDLLIERWGRANVARLGGAMIALGGLVLVLNRADIGALFFGLAAMGYGSATLVPSAFSAAAKLPGISEGAGVTIISWLMRLGFLFTSPLIGTITDTAGLRWGLGTLIIIGITTVTLAGALRPRPTSTETEVVPSRDKAGVGAA
ncbi:MFS transporter [Microbacterium hibisci]|uniref:MFS transporter n=1 Tax=Microbacterium hibisci TaxID=2036000 RepID=UPI0027D9FCCF|nr:MFS transporter [Microbacterium hibisci]